MSPPDRPRRYILGVDTGGTFTDFACLTPEGRWLRWKQLSTPDDPSRAILEGLEHLLPGVDPRELELVHGTTVGTNAFLQRKGARTCLITTKGFEDAIFIGRQARPSLYDLAGSRPPEIIPRRMVKGVAERMDWRGRPLLPLDPAEPERAVRFCRARGAESVAVCLLHSYANPAHERALAQALEAAGLPVSASHRVMAEFREFERCSTTLINAYLRPVVGRYVERLRDRLSGASIFVELSNGGAVPAEQVGEMAVLTLLSGPAGGVEAAWRLAPELKSDKIITLDMGGTSTDCAICPGRPLSTREYEIQGYPVALPMLNIHTVGAGGGSVAWLDRGGFLQVGPQSAGADPGPVCYGKGDRITVTDANLFLGRLRPQRFLAGRMALHRERMEREMARLAAQAGLSPLETALGIVELVNANMAGAIRRVSVERGYDPREFTLVCFGGAAGLHAAELAQALEISRVVIPALAGVFSALGMARADLSFAASRSIMVRDGVARGEEVAAAVEALMAELTSRVEAMGLERAAFRLEREVDVRYSGQSFEITIPFQGEWPRRFAQEHRRLYGFEMADRPLEVTTVRARVVVERGEAGLPGRYGPDAPSPRQASHERAPILFRDGAVEGLILGHEALDRRGVEGPAVLCDDYTTILVPPGWRARELGGHCELVRSAPGGRP